jgi:uncharacterized protein (DUF3820 family)
MIEHRLPFGRHEGQPLADVPTRYLLWFYTTCSPSAGLRQAIYDVLQARGDCPDGLQPPPPPAPLVCPRCNSAFVRVTWQERQDGTRILRADCTFCGGFIRFLPLLPEFIDRVEEPSPGRHPQTCCTSCGRELTAEELETRRDECFACYLDSPD